jgi:hypothetical protein
MAEQFEHFDQRIADGLIKANSAITGLPKFLDAQITAVTAGHLTATVAVRPDLITRPRTLLNFAGRSIVAACLIVFCHDSVCANEGRGMPPNEEHEPAPRQATSEKQPWSMADASRGPKAIANAPLLPFRAAAGVILLGVGTSSMDKPYRLPLAILLSPVVAAASVPFSVAYVLLGLGDTVTLGAFRLAPDEATDLSWKPIVPMWGPMSRATTLDAIAA